MQLQSTQPMASASTLSHQHTKFSSAKHNNATPVLPEQSIRVVYARVCPTVTNHACCVLEMVPMTPPAVHDSLADSNVRRTAERLPTSTHVDVTYDTTVGAHAKGLRNGVPLGVHGGNSSSRKNKRRARGGRSAATCCLCPRSRIARSVLPQIFASAPMGHDITSFYVMGLCADSTVGNHPQSEPLRPDDVTRTRWSTWYRTLMTSLAASGEALVVNMLHPFTHVPCTACLVPITMVGGMLTIVDTVTLHHGMASHTSAFATPDPRVLASRTNAVTTGHCVCGCALPAGESASHGDGGKRRRTPASEAVEDDLSGDTHVRAATGRTPCQRCCTLPLGVAMTPLRPHLESSAHRIASDDANAGFASSFVDWFTDHSTVRPWTSRTTRDALSDTTRTALTTSQVAQSEVHTTSARAAPSATVQHALVAFLSQTLQNADARSCEPSVATCADTGGIDYHPPQDSHSESHEERTHEAALDGSHRVFTAVDCGGASTEDDSSQPLPSDARAGVDADDTLSIATHYRHRLTATERPLAPAMTMTFISQRCPQHLDTPLHVRDYWQRVANDLSTCMHDVTAVDKLLDESSTEAVQALATMTTPNVAHGEFTIRLLQLQVVLRLHALAVHHHRRACDDVDVNTGSTDAAAVDVLVARTTHDVLSLMARLSPLMDLMDPDANSLVGFLKTGLVPAFQASLAPLLRHVFEDLELDRDMPSPLRDAMPMAAPSPPSAVGSVTGGDGVSNDGVPPMAGDSNGASTLPDPMGAVVEDVLPDSATATVSTRLRGTAASATTARWVLAGSTTTVVGSGHGDDVPRLVDGTSSSQRVSLPQSQTLKHVTARQITVQFNRPASRTAQRKSRAKRSTASHRRVSSASASTSNIVVLDTPAKEQQRGSSLSAKGRAANAAYGGVSLPFVARRSRRPSANVVQESPAIQVAKARAKRQGAIDRLHANPLRVAICSRHACCTCKRLD